mmetsp:Transcript_23696/g.49173  ORF Transcript_23696/g.49173 Transcript_23696/m.49173 type:complete len:317 (+) Transcript_23696:178-1128(+)
MLMFITLDDVERRKLGDDERRLTSTATTASTTKATPAVAIRAMAVVDRPDPAWADTAWLPTDTSAGLFMPAKPAPAWLVSRAVDTAAAAARGSSDTTTKPMLVTPAEVLATSTTTAAASRPAAAAMLASNSSSDTSPLSAMSNTTLGFGGKEPDLEHSYVPPGQVVVPGKYAWHTVFFCWQGPAVPGQQPVHWSPEPEPEPEPEPLLQSWVPAGQVVPVWYSWQVPSLSWRHGPALLPPHSSQRTGHLWVLQDWSSSRWGHCWPPFCGATLMERERDWLPPPHSAEHLDHLDHSDTTQSTAAHGAVPGGQVVVPYM